MPDDRSRTRGGQSLVEFALILPLLVLFIMVIFDLGRIAYIYSAIHNAAREGARYAAVHGAASVAGTEAAARRLTAGLDQSAMTVSISSPVPEQVEVVVTYDFNPATPIILWLTGSGSNTFTLTTQATMRLE
jgi:Flp pilus assembly protein TadG